MTERRLSAGVVVVRDTPDGARILMLRAYKNWDFPKGLVEPGEEPRAAAVRETVEEAGIDDLAFDWGHEHFDTAPYARNKVARFYLARTRVARVVLGVNPQLGRPEHHEFRWVDLAEAYALAPPRLQPVISWAAGKLMAAAQLAR
ncbi:MAG TPA: NUDIX domain-containing protein [Gammaproteobacteria bacterium]|nr:NUDIX domain-containing protein [Gammaproteobacteria bacterium]